MSVSDGIGQTPFSFEHYFVYIYFFYFATGSPSSLADRRGPYNFNWFLQRQRPNQRDVNAKSGAIWQSLLIRNMSMSLHGVSCRDAPIIGR